MSSLQHQTQQASVKNFYTEDIRPLFEAGNTGELTQKMRSGLRLTKEQALWLFKHPDLFTLGKWASLVSTGDHPPRVLYNINRHINPTNICVYSCKFCAYAKKPTEEGAYAYSLEEIAKKTQEAADVGADEVHVVGGLHPRWGLDHFQKILRTIKEVAPHIHIKGFTAVEIFWLARRSKKSIADTLKALREAGLGSLPGGGAEVFDEEIRKLITAKMDSKTWLDIHRTAHNLGMNSNATLLYGHIEKPVHRINHLHLLRDLQDETAGFNAFIPLAFQPHNNEMGITHDTLGVDDLRTLAIARLYLDNFHHIKAYWIMLGQDIAQIGTHFGANDLDGTVYEEKISRAAGGRSGMLLSTGSLHHLILSAGKLPRRRSTLYKLIPYELPPEKDPSLKPHLPPFFGEPLSDDTLKHTKNLLKELQVGKGTSEKLPLDLLRPEMWHDLMTASAAVKRLGSPKIAIGNATYAPALNTLKSMDLDQRIKTLTSLSPTTLIYRFSQILSHAFLEKTPTLQKKSLMAQIQVLCECAKELHTTHPHLRQILAWPLSSHPEKHLDHEIYTEVLEKLNPSHIKAFIPEQPSDDEPIPDFNLEDHYGFISSKAQKKGWDQITGVVFLPIKKDGGIDWRSFLESLQLMAQKYSDVWNSTELRVPDKNKVTPSEYLQAVALTRLTIGASHHLITPLLDMPIISPKSGKGRGRKQHPEEKILGLLLLVGVDDLGLWPAETYDFESLQRIAQHVGFDLVAK